MVGNCFTRSLSATKSNLNICCSSVSIAISDKYYCAGITGRRRNDFLDYVYFQGFNFTCIEIIIKGNCFDGVFLGFVKNDRFSIRLSVFRRGGSAVKGVHNHFGFSRNSSGSTNQIVVALLLAVDGDSRRRYSRGVRIRIAPTIGIVGYCKTFKIQLTSGIPSLSKYNCNFTGSTSSKYKILSCCSVVGGSSCCKCFGPNRNSCGYIPFFG